MGRRSLYPETPPGYSEFQPTPPFSPRELTRHLLKHLRRIDHALLKPNILPPQNPPDLIPTKTHPPLGPAIAALVIRAGRPHRYARALRVRLPQHVGRGLRGDAAVDDEVALVGALGGVLDAPDVHGGDVADVDEGADAVDGRDGGRRAGEEGVVGFEGFVDGGGGGGGLDGRAGHDAGVDGYDGPVGL